MRLVFDTNVLIAAHLTPGHCATLYQEALIAATLLSSDPILTEFEEKLVAKGKVKPGEAARMRAEVAEDCTLVVPARLAAPVCRDPDDDVILATAIAADADLIVTGDKDLLVLKEFQQIPIVTPAECFARLTRNRE